MITQRFRWGLLLAGGLMISLTAQAQVPVEVASTGKTQAYVALGLAIIALIGLVLIWRQVQQMVETLTTKRKQEGGVAETAKLADRLSRLEKERVQMAERIALLEKTVTQLRERPVLRNEPPKQPESIAQKTVEPIQPVRINQINEPSPATNPASWQQQKPVANVLPAKLYARTADVPGGFSVNGLVENPNRPMVFVIVPTSPSSATFRVADDPEAQRLALSDPYSYLSDACNYQSRPESNSRIHTITDGKLQLQGEKWHIIEKAEISFYA